MRPAIQKYNPAVDKKVLIALSGIMWLVVGIVLCSHAVNWLSQPGVKNSMWLLISGMILSLLIHHFGFLRLVYNNLERILSQKDKVCIFAFQAWKSYLIIAIMIGIGIALRHSSLPKPYLSVIYIGFGGAMLLSSLKYFWVLFKLILNPYYKCKCKIKGSRGPGVK